MKLKDKVALVTGSSRGIGRKIAEIFAEEGANVVINCLQRREEANALAETIKSQTQTSPFVVQADVSVSQQVMDLIAQTMEQFGRIDILVNNAGITIRGTLADLDEAKWDQVIDTNLKGPFLCSQAVTEVMVKQGSGTIINIASIRGITGSSSSLHYAVSKAGVIAMTKSMALELAPQIRVNAIAPGYTYTDLQAHLDEADIAKVEATIPLGRFGKVDDIASATLFLASDDSSYITGETLVVSGGLAMR